VIAKPLLNRQFVRRTKVTCLALSIVTVTIITAALAVGITPGASADPRRLPPEPAVVGVGNDATEVVFDQLSRIYNTEHLRGRALDSYWATGSATIVPKAGCQPIERPNGSSPGVLTLLGSQILPDGTPCLDFARSLSPRTPGAPSTLVWTPFALDAIGWAANAGSNAPRSLTTADLKAILECTATRWDQVGGTSDEAIDAYLPAHGPGILTLLQHMAGVDQIGSCVGYAQQDQGTIPGIAGNPNALVFYSVGKYIAQAFEGIADVHGDLVLGEVNGLSPVVFDPASNRVEINAGQVRGVAAFPSAFLLPEWVVLAQDPDGTVSPQLARLFLGSGSWICTDPRALSAIQHYGFLLLPPGQCGQPS
jgi:ABC-type phosphate transport system substrate-binding protein